MEKQDVTEVIGFEPKIGGSYWYEKETFHRPNWLHGVYIQGSRLLFHPNDNWVRIEHKIEGEWEKFFEGSVDNKEDLYKLLKQTGYNE